MKKKILIVDDSALMRRVLCDIINSDERFEVADYAVDGAEGFKKLCAKTYDAVVLDVYMPKMTGLEMLREMQKSKVYANVLMASTTTGEGAKETMEALDLGAVDFIKKPENVADARVDEFRQRFLTLLDVVTKTSKNHMARAYKPDNGGVRKATTFTARYDVNFHTLDSRNTASNVSRAGSTAETKKTESASVGKKPVSTNGNKLVAIASSTGGPKALQEVIPRLPGNLKAPVLLVQHMPKGFTQSLASRLNDLSEITVSEAKAGEAIESGHVYIAAGGSHLKLEKAGSAYKLALTDEPTREGVKPCANYMYESLMNSGFDEIVCVVLTGMGCDGTVGIRTLKEKKKVRVIAQEEESCTVYGMPRSIVDGGLADDVVSLSDVAEHIIKNVGVY